MLVDSLSKVFLLPSIFLGIVKNSELLLAAEEFEDLLLLGFGQGARANWSCVLVGLWLSWLGLWLWLWFLWTWSTSALARLDLVDFERCDPLDAYHTPEALLVHSDEAEALQRHGLGVVVLARVQELVTRDPLGEGAGVLPVEPVVLGPTFRDLLLHLLVGSAVDRFADNSGLCASECCGHQLLETILFFSLSVGWISSSVFIS